MNKNCFFKIVGGESFLRLTQVICDFQRGCIIFFDLQSLYLKKSFSWKTCDLTLSGNFNYEKLWAEPLKLLFE